MTAHRYRVIDAAGSELGIITADHEVGEGDRTALPEGGEAEVVELYDDEHGQDGGVAATLVVDVQEVDVQEVDVQEVDVQEVARALSPARRTRGGP